MLRVEYIADQLRAMMPGADWHMAGVDRAVELAAMFDRVNVLDLSALRVVRSQGLVQVFVPTPDTGDGAGGEWVPTLVDGYAFSYRGRIIGYMGTPTEPRADSIFLADQTKGLLCGWSAEGHGNVGYVVRGNVQTNTLEIVPVWGSSSEAAYIRDNLLDLSKFVVFAALPLAGISAGAALGAQILGPAIAGAYPSLAAVLGNTALATAFNGGDVREAARGAVTGFVTGGVSSGAGSAIARLAESPVLGVVTEAATRAAISGGDVKTAVALSLASVGSKMDFSSLPDVSIYQLPPNYDFGMTTNAFEVPISLDQAFGFDALPPAFDYQFSPLATGFGSDPLGYTFDPLTPDGLFSFDPLSPTGSLGFQVDALPVFDPPASFQAIQNQPDTWNPTPIVNGITQAAMAALTVAKAFQSLRTPQIQSTARVVRPDGSVAVVSPNGTIQTRTATGAVVSTRPPVGVPQATIDGGWVLNNGDGTYLYVTASGATARYSYDSTTATTPGVTGAGGAGGFQVTPAVLALGGVALFLALR